MDQLTRENVEALIKHHRTPCISIYMPTEFWGQEEWQDPIRLKNLYREAEQQLYKRDFSPLKAQQLMNPIRMLINDHTYWQHQGDGLAVFRSPDFFEAYRLPVPFKEEALVADYFKIKPLLPIMSQSKKFFILSLSQNEVKLYRGTPYTVTELDVKQFEKEFPKDALEALQFVDSQQALRPHQVTEGKRPSRERSHDQHTNANLWKIRLFEYFRQIDRALNDFFGEKHDPLVLAGVDYYFPVYRQANTYPVLMKQGIPENPEEQRPEELHARAWHIVEPYFKKGERDAANRYQFLEGSKRGPVSNNTKEIVRSAIQGRVDTLFLQPDLAQWGLYDERTENITLHDDYMSGDIDLMEFAAAQTYLNKGVIYAVDEHEMPSKSPLAAIYRY